MTEKFSIVTSFFGENPDYILRLYNSVKSQGVDWEWIVTDDFSDNPVTDDVLLQLSNSDVRVKRIVQKYKREMYINPSVYATGDFIFHIDGDDLVSTGYLQNCLYWFRKFPDVVVILSGSRWRNKRGHLEKYFLHHPFLDPTFINGQVMPPMSYLGRVWRASQKIDWSGIFSNPEQMIRKNDYFIVKFLSTKGEVLCLPRCFMEYETGKISNSTVERTPEEVEIIKKFDIEFEKWYEVNKSTFPWNPHFCTKADIDFEIDCYPFYGIDWHFRCGRMGVFGFSKHLVKRKLLTELFQDFEVIFEPASANDFDFLVVDARNSKIQLPQGKRVFLLTSSPEDHQWYSSQLSGRRYSWFNLHERTWIEIF